MTISTKLGANINSFLPLSPPLLLLLPYSHSLPSLFFSSKKPPKKKKNKRKKNKEDSLEFKFELAFSYSLLSLSLIALILVLIRIKNYVVAKISSNQGGGCQQNEKG